MSVRALTEAFRERTTKDSRRLVMLTLADEAHDDGVTWVSQERIADKTNLAVATARDAIRALEQTGIVETRKAQKKRKRFNVYRLTFPALEEVDYERLPFVLDTPFTTTTEYARSSNDDHGIIGSTTTGSSAPTRARDPLGPVTRTRNELATLVPAVPAEPPKVKLTASRVNRPLDALMNECGVDPGNRQRVKWATAALYGDEHTQGIVHLYWLEVTRWLTDPDHPTRIELVVEATDRERYTVALTKAIRNKADLYRREMDGARLTPTALRAWWLDIEKGNERTLTDEQLSRMTNEELMNFGR